MSAYTLVESTSEVERLIAESETTPVLFFKHSLTCPISSRAFGEYQSFLAERPEDDATVYTLVEIQNARPVSQEIAERTGVRHESPQALLVRGGEVAWDASHYSIRADALAAAVGGWSSTPKTCGRSSATSC